MTNPAVDPRDPAPALRRYEPVLRPVDAAIPTDELDLDELGSRIVAAAGRLASAMASWLLLVARFDARAGHDRFGLPSTARWLSHACGIAHRTAVEHVRVARALAAFPALADALGSGRLSYSHARAIARLATAGEHRLVDDLIEVARAGTVGQLETVVRGLRTVEDNETDDGHPPPEYVRHSWTSTSHWRLNARLDPENGAVVQSAVEQVARAEGLTHAQALLRMAEIALAACADSDSPPRPLRGEERAAIIVHLDAGRVPADDAGGGLDRRAAEPTPTPGDPGSAPGDPTLTPDDPASALDNAAPASGDAWSAPGDAAPAPGDEPPAPGDTVGSPRVVVLPSNRPCARIADGPGLPMRVVERLLCAGRIRTAGADRSGEVAVLGRSHRLVTDRQYRALLLRHGRRCAHPGCGSRHGLEAHHVLPWIRGGRTDLTNLVLLCPRHHHAHHDGAFRIVRTGGCFVFLRRDGRELEQHVDPARLQLPGGADSGDAAAPAGAPVLPPVDPVPAAVRLAGGDRLDRDWAVAVLAGRRDAARTHDDRPPVTWHRATRRFA